MTADELGRSPGVNAGILEAHRHGIVTGASVLVSRPASEEAAERVRDHPELELGLQLDLGEWVCRGGEWHHIEARVPANDPDAVAEELTAQLGRFRELFGREPTQLGSHQCVHRSEPARSVMLARAKSLGIPLRHFTSGIFVCTEFFGQTSKGEPFPRGIGVDRLVAIIGALPPGVTELVCHPGYPDQGAGGYGPERVVERRALCSPRVRAALRAHDVTLGSFEGLRGEVSVLAERYESSFRERGRAALARGDYEKACYWFECGVAVDDSQPATWLWLSRAQLRTGCEEAARSSAERAVALRPDWPHALLHLADLVARQDGCPEAVARLLLAAADHGSGAGDGEVFQGILRRLLQLEDGVAARRVAARLVGAYPGGEEARLARAALLWRSGRRTDADRALAQRTDGTGKAHGAALFYLEAGEPRRAWEAVRSRNGAPLEGRLGVRIAHALRRSGDLPLAWEAFERVLLSDPEHADARGWRDDVVGEVHVLTGAWDPIVRPSGGYAPVPGRVLHLVGKSLPYAQTGYSVRTGYITRAQRGAGLDPHVATQLGFPWNQGVEEASKYEEVDGIPHHRLVAPCVPRRLDERLDLNLQALIPLVRRLRPEVLHAASDYRNALLALALRESFGLPVIYEVRGFWEETWRSKQRHDGAHEAPAYRWRRERELQCMRAADRVVTLGEMMKRDLVARGIQERKIAVVPNAVDPVAFGSCRSDPELARRLGIEPGEVVLGYVSSFVSYEGIPLLIEAVARLAQRGHPVRGLLVGDGAERHLLEATAKRLGVRDRIIFAGRIPHADIAAYYGLIDVFVVPRTGDRVCRLVTPLKPYEAMATGRAVVVSGVPALREMVLPGRTGLVFHPEDLTSLVQVVEPLLDSPEQRAALGQAARRWVCEHRTWQQNGERYAQLCRELRQPYRTTPRSLLARGATGARGGVREVGP